jgi:hypothetical protein
MEFSGSTDKFKSRIDVTKFLCNYIKDNNLYNPENRREIRPDERLIKLLKYDPVIENTLTYFFLQEKMNHLFYKYDKYFACIRIQRAFRYKRQKCAATIIQNGCHNWLWKPKCDDGTVGIQCRMMVKELEGLQE